MTATTETPILFNAEMVCAILSGNKTQTRRPVKPGKTKSPFGNVGGSLWVREAFRLRADQDDKPPKDDWWKSGAWYYADDPSLEPSGCQGGAGKLRPSIHMPRWASRINLRVTNVRVERLQDASKGDLVHEGWPDADEVASAYASVCKSMHECIDDGVVEWFADAWDDIYAKQGFGWDANPMVWCCEFEVIS